MVQAEVRNTDAFLQSNSGVLEDTNSPLPSDCSPLDKSFNQQTFKSDVSNFPLGGLDPEKDLGYSSSNSSNYSDLGSEEDSSCSSGGCLFLKSSFLKELRISSTEERSLIDEFDNEVNKNMDTGDTMGSALMLIKNTVDKYMEKGIRLNLRYGDHDTTVAESIFDWLVYVTADKELGPGGRVFALSRGHNVFQNDENCNENSKKEVLEEENIIIIEYIIHSVFLAGGKIQVHQLNSGEITHVTYREDYDAEGSINEECKEIESQLKGLAYQSVVNESKQILQNGLEVELDNKCLYIKYMQDSIIKVAKVINNQEIQDLGLRVCILHIGESIVRVERLGEKRNYTDISGSIEMSFTTEVGTINIYLCSGKGNNSNKIEVEFADEESKAKFNELEDKSNLGAGCLLGGKNVAEVIGKSFERSSVMSTESTEDIKQSNDAVNTPSTFIKQVNSLDQLQKEKERVFRS
ncbi:hypothetical protein [Wolbachia endosymbiont (group A) of Philonthus cognatus]|uniref:hypothetical protein n=1 Tax=Wolbachia endosymbiont (group A) of Philonthus cognatus TaxID=2954046 RepID=UPI0022320CEB|nr:hypothetical protein [Wolbachia endosymbiont (group A) of Philonthus cognatus]